MLPALFEADPSFLQGDDVLVRYVRGAGAEVFGLGRVPVAMGEDERREDTVPLEGNEPPLPDSVVRRVVGKVRETVAVRFAVFPAGPGLGVYANLLRRNVGSHANV